MSDIIDGANDNSSEVGILLVEDHTSFREALAYLLRSEPGFSVLAEAGTIAEARTVLEGSDRIDVAVTDIGLPDGDGIDLVREITDTSIIVLVLTASVNREDFARAVEAGASGVMNKSAAVKDIVGSVRRLRAGEALLSPNETIEMLRLASKDRQKYQSVRSSFERLTPREREVLNALSEGLDSEGIARKLHITIETERTHVVNILTKLGVHSRVQALSLAVRHGFIKFDRNLE